MLFPNFTQPQQFFEVWTEMAKAHVERMEQLGVELAKLQGQNVERAQTAIDESAKLMKASLEAGNQLANEWRKIGVEMTRKATASV